MSELVTGLAAWAAANNTTPEEVVVLIQSEGMDAPSILGASMTSSFPLPEARQIALGGMLERNRNSSQPISLALISGCLGYSLDALESFVRNADKWPHQDAVVYEPQTAIYSSHLAAFIQAIKQAAGESAPVPEPAGPTPPVSSDPMGRPAPDNAPTSDFKAPQNDADAGDTDTPPWEENAPEDAPVPPSGPSEENHNPAAAAAAAVLTAARAHMKAEQGVSTGSQTEAQAAENGPVEAEAGLTEQNGANAETGPTADTGTDAPGQSIGASGTQDNGPAENPSDEPARPQRRMKQADAKPVRRKTKYSLTKSVAAGLIKPAGTLPNVRGLRMFLLSQPEYKAADIAVMSDSEVSAIFENTYMAIDMGALTPAAGSVLFIPKRGYSALIESLAANEIYYIPGPAEPQPGAQEGADCE